jgi:EXLDI family protein
MANKTIYVSNKDENVYKEAQKIAGEALSSVISRALKEFVDRSKALKGEMRQISVGVGPENSTREQRFIGNQVGKWKGFSRDKAYWQTANIYETQKNYIVVHLTTVSKAEAVTDPKNWKNTTGAKKDIKNSELLIAKKVTEFSDKVAPELLTKVKDSLKKEEVKVDYLDL